MNTVMRHTPGPWVCFYKHKYDEWHVSVPILHSATKWALFDDGVCSDNPEADARIISAAPDMLAALEGVLRVADRTTDEFDAVRAAIAKALGREA